MKKIPTLFEREFANHKVVSIMPIVTPGLEWVLNGEGIATIKYDGACCAIFNGLFYKRYDAKNGKLPPSGAIPCQQYPDPITGHWPHWVMMDRDNPADRWFWMAFDYSRLFCGLDVRIDATYEAVGWHFQGNPYQIKVDRLIRHGCDHINITRSYDGIYDFLLNHNIEGVVFWKDGAPRCKIKRSDFGLAWPIDNVIPYLPI